MRLPAIRALAIFVVLSPAPATAQSLGLPRRTGPITVDGSPDEAAWKDAVSVSRFFEIGPGDNVEPPVRTVGLLAYDQDYLYVGVRCQDPQPAHIRAPYVDRDRVAEQDFVQIDLDARDEGRWSMIFRVNPRGVQADGVFDEAVGVDDFSPDFHFDSAARITADGWTAELKIPLSTLRYRAKDPQTWRLTFYRLYPRRFRHQITSNAIPRGSNCWLCHSLRFTGLTGLPHGGRVSVAPFVTGALRNQGTVAARGDHRLAVGGDVKWLPTPNLAADFALNPDFSQVESDVTQIGINNRFALYYPEKRPFFLEGLDLWNSPIAVVHTRTITEPGWGARLTGRPGKASFTVLAAGDRGGGSVILPGPSSSRLLPQPADARVLLGRYRRAFGRSSLGTIATLREGAAGYFNRVGGADFQWYPTGKDHASGQVLRSATRDPHAARASGHAALLAFERSARHVTGSLLFEHIGREFRADSGFVPQTGIRHLSVSAGYLFYPQGFLRRIRPNAAYEDVREHAGPLVSQAARVGVAVDGRVQAALDWYPHERGRAGDGRLFTQDYWTASARILPNRRLPYLRLTVRRGDEIDIDHSRLGTGTAVTLSSNLSPVDRLQAELSGERRSLDVPGGARRSRLFTATVARAKLTYTFTARSLTRLVGEWKGLEEPAAGTPSERSFNGSVLYGYRVNWQSMVYLGYGNSAAPASAPERGRQQELFLKIAYSIRP